MPPILLHAAVAALYAVAAWARWPHAAVLQGASRSAVPARIPTSSAAAILVAALLLHGWVVWQDIVTPEGLDLSLANAVSLVGGLVAAVALVSGLLQTLPAMATIVLPVAALAALLPAFFAHPHDYAFSDKPLAAAHVAVALVSYALFLVAAVQALILMGVEKRLHRRLPDPSLGSAPPLLTLERFLFRLVATGFVLLTLTLASGMLFAEQVFGRAVPFTHKVVFSILGWLTFGALLFGRWRYGWRGRTALRWIIAGTVFVFLAYLGSKFVLEVLLGR
jgi:ABC-type uncharacterized transport system permease subunit